MMPGSIQPVTLAGADATPALATHPPRVVRYFPRAQSWDPYEVWLNRVHRPRAEQGARDALKAPSATVRDAGGVSASPLTIVQTIARY